MTGTGVAATLTHDMSGNWGFSFAAASVGLKVGPVSLSATNVTFNPSATGSQTLVSLSSLSVNVTLSRLSLTGTAGSDLGNIAIHGDGSFSVPPDFSVGVSIGAGSSGDLGWPSWIPIQIRSLVLTWPDLSADASNFTITLSAHIQGNYGTIALQGDVTNVVIDVHKLLNGEFPITSIDSGAISATGNVFGGTLDAALIIGVIKLDALNHQVQPGQPYDHTVFYAGIDGGFTMPDVGGLHIRFGLSQNGPLEAYVQVDAPLLIVPPIDLAIESLYGGITFDATPFPSIASATDLKSPVFSPGTQLQLDQWEKQLKQEVVNQAGGGSGGYLFTITDGASDIAAALSSGTISQSLSDQFLTYGDVLSSSTASAASLNGVQSTKVVTELSGREWLIVDNTTYYVIQQNLSGGLDVSKERFVVDSAGTNAAGTVPTVDTIVTALNSGTVTDDVISAFKAYGISIDNTATIKADAPRSGQPVAGWTITLGSFKYHVAKDAAGILRVESSGGSMDSLKSVIRIEAAVTLGLEGIPKQDLSITGDVIIETDGKILLNAYAFFGGSGGGQGQSLGQSVNFRGYFDLSQVASGGAVKSLFWFEKDINLPGGIILPQLTIAAGATFAPTDANGTLLDPGTNPNWHAQQAGFAIKLDGLIVYSPLPAVTLTLTGQAQLTFTSTLMTLQFNASLSASITQFIQANNVVSAAGTFTIRYAADQFALWGAAELKFDSGAIPFLQDAGISASAEVFLRINSDASAGHQVTFNLPTAGVANGFTPETFNLQPASFGLYLVGSLSFNKGPVSFGLNGVFDVDFKQTGSGFKFDVFVFAELHLGIAGQDILKMDALGLLEINDHGFAAMLSISNHADLTVLHFDFDFTLFVNTTGQAVSYTLPSDLTAILGQMSGAVPASGGGTSATPVDGGILAALTTQLQRLGTLYGAGHGGYAAGTGPNLTLTIPAGMPLLAENGSSRGNAVQGPTW